MMSSHQMLGGQMMRGTSDDEQSPDVRLSDDERRSQMRGVVRC